MDFEVKTIAGVTTLFANLEGANSTTVLILVKAGSIYETRPMNGISHFLEHMFFKGGKKYKTTKEVTEIMDAFGADFNAFTSEEYAGYYVKSAPEYVTTSLDILADMMVDAQFPDAEMEKEKAVVVQEIMMYEDNPRRLVVDKWKNRYYGDNSFGRPILGTTETLASFTQDDLFRHKEELYTKDNLIVVVAGALPHQKDLEEQIGTCFGGLPEKASIMKPGVIPYTPATHTDRYEKGTKQNHIVIGCDGFSMHDDRHYAASILSTMLGGTMSSRLFQEIREKQGLCYYVGAGHEDNDLDGVFYLWAGIEKGRRQQGLEALHAEVAKVASGDIHPQEIEKALGNIKGKTQMGIETSDELARFIGFQYLFKHDVQSLEEILHKYEEVTLEHVKEVAKKLAEENLYGYWIE